MGKRVKQAVLPLALLLAACAPRFDQAGMLVQMNAGYSQIAAPTVEWPISRIGSASKEEFATWLVPDWADTIDDVVLRPSPAPAPAGNVVIELTQRPQRVRSGVCETASNLFVGTDQTVQGKPTVRIFSGSHSILYRAADENGGCTKKPEAPLGFSALSPDAAESLLRAYKDAVAALRPENRESGLQTGYLSPSQIRFAQPCLGESRCFQFDLEATDAAPYGLRLTYHYGAVRRAWLQEPSSPPPA